MGLEKGTEFSLRGTDWNPMYVCVSLGLENLMYVCCMSLGLESYVTIWCVAGPGRPRETVTTAELLCTEVHDYLLLFRSLWTHSSVLVLPSHAAVFPLRHSEPPPCLLFHSLWTWSLNSAMAGRTYSQTHPSGSLVGL